MCAKLPGKSGFVDRDGVKICSEICGKTNVRRRRTMHAG
jgi:hypothetical protein